jgi:carboxylesterase type B
MEQWADAPMIKDAVPDIFNGISSAIRAMWISFVKTGKPAKDNIWSKYSINDRQTMRFDSIIGQVGDLTGIKWRGNLNPDGSIK